MSDHDIQLLVLGSAFGMYFMLLLQILYGILDDRRDRKAGSAALAAFKRSAGDRYLSSLRLYQLQQRSRV
jgi:hypothetical protein